MSDATIKITKKMSPMRAVRVMGSLAFWAKGFDTALIKISL